MEVNTAFCMKYILTSKANEGKSLCVTYFTCILYENQVHSAFCSLLLLRFGYFKDIFGDMKRLMTDIQKSPRQSLNETSMYIKAFLSAYDLILQLKI